MKLHGVASWFGLFERAAAQMFLFLMVLLLMPKKRMQALFLFLIQFRYRKLKHKTPEILIDNDCALQANQEFLINVKSNPVC